MRHWILILLTLLLLLPGAALADEVCTVKDASVAGHITTDCAYLKVCCPLDGETNVTLTVRDAWGGLLYQRDHGSCKGTFRSGEIHLPLQGQSADYTVSLQTDSAAHTFRVTRKAAMITDTAVYAGGLTLKDMLDGNARKYAVVLDLDALDEQILTVPMLSGNLQIGWVHFSVKDGVVVVSAELTVNGTIDKATVYVASDALTARSLGTTRFTGAKAKLNKEINLSRTPYAALMVQLTVTCDPAQAPAWRMGKEETLAYEAMLECWQLMQLTTANEAVG